MAGISFGSPVGQVSNGCENVRLSRPHLLWDTGETHTTSHVFDVLPGEAVVVQAIGLDVDDKFAVQQVTGCGSGDLFTPYPYTCGCPATICANSPRLIIPYAGRYRLTVTDGTPGAYRVTVYPINPALAVPTGCSTMGCNTFPSTIEIAGALSTDGSSVTLLCNALKGCILTGVVDLVMDGLDPEDLATLVVSTETAKGIITDAVMAKVDPDAIINKIVGDATAKSTLVTTVVNEFDPDALVARVVGDASALVTLRSAIDGSVPQLNSIGAVGPAVNYVPSAHQTYVDVGGNRSKFWSVNKFLMDAAATGFVDVVVSDTEPSALDRDKIWLDTVGSPDTASGQPKAWTGAVWDVLTRSRFFSHVSSTDILRSIRRARYHVDLPTSLELRAFVAGQSNAIGSTEIIGTPTWAATTLGMNAAGAFVPFQHNVAPLPTDGQTAVTPFIMDHLGAQLGITTKTVMTGTGATEIVRWTGPANDGATHVFSFTGGTGTLVLGANHILTWAGGSAIVTDTARGSFLSAVVNTGQIRMKLLTGTAPTVGTTVSATYLGNTYSCVVSQRIWAAPTVDRSTHEVEFGSGVGGAFAVGHVITWSTGSAEVIAVVDNGATGGLRLRLNDGLAPTVGQTISGPSGKTASVGVINGFNRGAFNELALAAYRSGWKAAGTPAHIFQWIQGEADTPTDFDAYSAMFAFLLSELERIGVIDSKTLVVVWGNYHMPMDPALMRSVAYNKANAKLFPWIEQADSRIVAIDVHNLQATIDAGNNEWQRIHFGIQHTVEMPKRLVARIERARSVLPLGLLEATTANGNVGVVPVAEKRVGDGADMAIASLEAPYVMTFKETAGQLVLVDGSVPRHIYLPGTDAADMPAWFLDRSWGASFEIDAQTAPIIFYGNGKNIDQTGSRTLYTPKRRIWSDGRVDVRFRNNRWHFDERLRAGASVGTLTWSQLAGRGGLNGFVSWGGTANGGTIVVNLPANHIAAGTAPALLAPTGSNVLTFRRLPVMTSSDATLTAIGAAQRIWYRNGVGATAFSVGETVTIAGVGASAITAVRDFGAIGVLEIAAPASPTAITFAADGASITGGTSGKVATVDGPGFPRLTTMTFTRNNTTYAEFTLDLSNVLIIE